MKHHSCPLLPSPRHPRPRWWMPLVLLALTIPLSAQIAQTAYVKASNIDKDDRFGSAVAMAGDTMVIGAPHEDSAYSGVNGIQVNNASDDPGAAYVFVRSANGGWSQQAYLKASDPRPKAHFGRAVAISGNVIAVGAPSISTELGAVYIFTRTGSTWQQTARLVPSNLDAGDAFGYSVALSGDTLLVGATGEASGTAGVDGNASHNGAQLAGAAYVFVRGGNGAWFQQAYLKASNTRAGAHFGWSVALDGNTAVVGAPDERSLNGNQSNQSGANVGAVYVFGRFLGVWGQQAYLKAAQPAQSARFGLSVAISGPVIACGSARSQLNVFVVGANGWERDPSFPSTLPGVGASAREVALSGDKLLIGLSGDSSAGTGVRWTPTPSSNYYSGAAYLYQRTTGGWERQAFLKASNAGNSDLFGTAVALSGNTAVIGATLEDSFATGINGNQLDNTAAESGAAYVFNVKGPFSGITAAARNGNTYTTDFFGPPGSTAWKVMASTDLIDFTIDKTPASTITELSAGQYRATTDLTGAGPNLFLRIEHE